MTSIPATVSQPAARAFKHLARAYDELAQAVKIHDNLVECYKTHESAFSMDKNLGLVAVTLERLEMRRIAQLKETYVAISLEDVVRKVTGANRDTSPGQDEIKRVESLVVRMVHPARFRELTNRSKNNPCMQLFPALRRW
jgi:hypothetical protein